MSCGEITAHVIDTVGVLRTEVSFERSEAAMVGETVAAAGFVRSKASPEIRFGLIFRFPARKNKGKRELAGIHAISLELPRTRGDRPADDPTMFDAAKGDSLYSSTEGALRVD